MYYQQESSFGTDEDIDSCIRQLISQVPAARSRQTGTIFSALDDDGDHRDVDEGSCHGALQTSDSLVAIVDLHIPGDRHGEDRFRTWFYEQSPMAQYFLPLDAPPSRRNWKLYAVAINQPVNQVMTALMASRICWKYGGRRLAGWTRQVEAGVDPMIALFCLNNEGNFRNYNAESEWPFAYTADRPAAHFVDTVTGRFFSAAGRCMQDSFMNGTSYRNIVLGSSGNAISSSGESSRFDRYNNPIDGDGAVAGQSISIAQLLEGFSTRSTPAQLQARLEALLDVGEAEVVQFRFATWADLAPSLTA